MAGTRGRPKDDGIDAALRAAVVRIVDEGDASALTVRSLVAAAGVTRDAFYRRYTGLGHFLVSLALAHFTIDPTTDTGSLEGDLLALQRDQVEMFSEPLTRRLLPLLIRENATDPSAAEAFATTFLLPRREAFVRMVDRAVARGEIGPVADHDGVLALVAGPMLIRTLLPAMGPVDDDLARSTASQLATVLRADPAA